ncbi:MAG: hypothetical protein JWM74_5249 [Myxococcaceae bacterium]|nr:hypothetical protein [Myxococcaceae bacterium]
MIVLGLDRHAHWTAAAIVMALVTTSGHALAQDSDHEKAVAAFEDARKMIDAGSCDTAVPRLKESIAFEPSVGARFSLADCYEKTDLLAAWRQLKDAEMLAYMNHDERMTNARDRALGLEKRLPTIHITVPRALLDQAGLEVRLDGALVDRFQYKDGVVATAPGTHVVSVTMPKKTFSQEVVVQTGSPQEVTVRLVDEAPPAPPPARAAPPEQAVVEADPGSGRRTLGWLTVGVGAVGLGLGATFGLVALDRRTTLQIACGGDTVACTAPKARVDELQSSADSASTISTVSFILGGVAVAGGVALVLTAPTRASSQAATVRVAPAVGAGGGGMTMLGTW